MSLRALASRMLHNVRFICRVWSPSSPKCYLFDGVLSRKILPEARANQSAGASPRFLQVFPHARRIFVDNVLNRVTNSLNSELSRKAARELLYGNSRPFFTLVGVSLASESGLLTKEDELEGVCWEIREAVSKLRMIADKNLTQQIYLFPASLSIKDFDLGPSIAKGCNAIVYSAKYKGPIQVEPTHAYPLAIKMIFNYYAESNASSILKAMFRETVPAKQIAIESETSIQESFSMRRKALPAHPNIVDMPQVFADQVPFLPDSMSIYPSALPPRLNPESGMGRNMSLFLVMKRYDCSLREYLTTQDVPERYRTLLFAQLLEGVAHMYRNGISHRDLKSDNLLLDLSESDICPLLVVSDFGCCLADSEHGMRLPFSSNETDRGGNIALMAPEVASARPGPFTSIDYSKADLWAAATLGYEIFGAPNPFGMGQKLRSYNYEESDIPSPPKEMPELFRELTLNLLKKNPSNRLSAEVAANVCQIYLWGPSSWLRGTKPSSNEIVQWLLCLTTKVLCESRPVGGNSPVHVSASSRRRTFPEYQLIASLLSRVAIRGIRQAIAWIQSSGPSFVLS